MKKDKSIFAGSENAFICYNCAKLRKCRKACLHTTNEVDCEEYKLYDLEQYRKNLTELAEILGASPWALLHRIKRKGWETVQKQFEEKGYIVIRINDKYDERYKRPYSVYYAKKRGE